MEELKEFIVYDTIIKEPYLIKGSSAVAKFTGILPNHVWQYVDELTLFNDRYAIYSKEVLDKPSMIDRRGVVPARWLQMITVKASEEYKKDFHDALVNKYPQLTKSKPIYIFNANTEIIKVVNTYDEVAEHFNIPLGTVKSRLNRIKDWDGITKFKMIKLENYNTLTRSK